MARLGIHWEYGEQRPHKNSDVSSHSQVGRVGKEGAGSLWGHYSTRSEYKGRQDQQVKPSRDKGMELQPTGLWVLPQVCGRWKPNDPGSVAMSEAAQGGRLLMSWVGQGS